MKNIIKPIDDEGISLKTKLIVGTLITIGTLVGLNIFFDHYRLQTPIVIKLQLPVEERIINPILEQKRQIIEKPTATPTPTPAKVSLYDRTRELESNTGRNPNPNATHNYCKRKGLINEIGYFPNGNRHFCFKDEADQKRTFNLWLAKRLKQGYSVNEAMCLYVEGVKTENCKRVRDLLVKK